MRLWPLSILSQLPRQQLLGQHRECCALRGKGWGRKHATVDYVFKHPLLWLVRYHEKIMFEMRRRGYEASTEWWSPYYRGKSIGFTNGDDLREGYRYVPDPPRTIYPEHDEQYLRDCIANLARKGVKIKISPNASAA